MVRSAQTVGPALSGLLIGDRGDHREPRILGGALGQVVEVVEPIRGTRAEEQVHARGRRAECDAVQDRRHPRQVDHHLREDVAIRDDDAQVGRERAKLLEELVAARLVGLQHRDPFGSRDFLVVVDELAVDDCFLVTHP